MFGKIHVQCSWLIKISTGISEAWYAFCTIAEKEWRNNAYHALEIIMLHTVAYFRK